MQIIEFGKKLNSPIVICLGYFGCMHLGHRELVARAKKIASKNNAQVALFTFSNNHLKVLGKDVEQIFTFNERLDIYQQLGIDVVIHVEFTEQFKKMSAVDFLNTLSCYKIKGVVCGFDYTCGNDRKNSLFIQEYFENIPVEIVDTVCVDGEKVGTTLIRELLFQCKIENANKLLFQPFFITGSVVNGRGVGKALGFPTANIQVYFDKFLPLGVFCGHTNVDGKRYKCVVNIGEKPTYGINTPTVEAHLLDFGGNLYGKELKLFITKYLRPTQKFQNEQQLIQQIKIDKESCLDD